MITRANRSYEVSLWTLQDEFVTVLKWSDIEPREGHSSEFTNKYSTALWKGTIQDPKFIIADDGTENFSFTIPMYVYESGKLIENPIWYNTRNGNLMINLRKIKVTFNKHTADKRIFEFLITKITEEHESDHLFCKVECEGLAFHELGKVGYKYNLSSADYELDYKEWQESTYPTEETRPLANVQYWCEKIGLTPWPDDISEVDNHRWYYEIQMDYTSFENNLYRDAHKVYEEPFISSWESINDPDNGIYELRALETESRREKERTIEVENSNIYNITQSIAESFNIFCKYEYMHDNNGYITAKKVIFFNSFLYDKQIMSFTYPYSSKAITRELDSTDLVTKLYVPSVEDNTTLLGEASICDCKANRTGDEYLLNFDYLYETNSISKQQYLAVKNYEGAIFKINADLRSYERKISIYENEINDLEAKKAYYESSIALDKEQRQNNMDYVLALTVGIDGTEDNLISCYNADNPDYTLIAEDADGRYCISLNNKKKGIKTSTVKIYRNYSSTNKTFSNEITNFTFSYDDNGNPTAIYGVSPANGSSAVYMTYDYEPKLYYDAIIKSWEEKLAQDEMALAKIDLQLNNMPDHQLVEGETFDFGLNYRLTTAKTMQNNLLVRKERTIKEFNELMGPALREGYWQPENYTNYGRSFINTHTLPEAYSEEPMWADTGNDFLPCWDTKLFESEQDIYYETSINQNIVYYPCINLTSLMSNTDFTNNLNRISFTFYNNYYDSSANAQSIKNIQSFSIGSEAILSFVKNPNNEIFPVLILVGAKNMTTDGLTVDGQANKGTIDFMLSPTSGHPRLSVLTTTQSGKNITVAETVIATIDSSFYSFGGFDIGQCESVYPRIKFSSLMLKTSEDTLSIRYKNKLLKNYDDYYINNRPIEANNYETVFLITLKPRVLIKSGNLRSNIVISYTLSNANEAIYLDALEISRENSKPRVSYTVNPNILDRNLIATLYNKLSWVVMINDAQLKFKEAFGYISRIELDLDFPDKDSIEVKNYETKFEDIFTTIVAQTEEMKSNEQKISAAVGGDIALSSDALSVTLEEQEETFNMYLDHYFDTSDTVQSKLESLFTDVGKILSGANKTLNQVQSLTGQNASILSEFSKSVNDQLTIKVYKSKTRPSTFKPGDVWVQTDDSNNEIARYVATSSSDSFTSNRTGTGGFARAYDGTIASMTGASLDINADDGNIALLAKNSIEIKSGGYLYLASENVDIVGNNVVNIGGAQVNIVSLTKGGTTYNSGGINLISSSYSSSGNYDQVTRIEMKPTYIKMAGAKIDLMTGNGNSAVSSVSLDGGNGIYIGSSKSITLFSGAATAQNPYTGANVEINPTHILLGVSSASNVSAMEMTKDYFILSVKGNITTLESSNPTTSIVGVKITKEGIWMAASDASNNSLLSIQPSGIVLGTVGSNNSGTFVSIAQGGIVIGSSSSLTVNASNLNIVTSSGTQNIEAYMSGFTMTPDSIWLGVKNANKTSNGSSITISESLLSLTATSGNDTSSISLSPQAIMLDAVPNKNYIHMNSNGIDVKGNSIKINDLDIWSHENIIIMNPNGDSLDAIEAERANEHDWVLIKPSYNASVAYYLSQSNTQDTVAGTHPLDRNDNVTIGDGATWYNYHFVIKVQALVQIQNMQGYMQYETPFLYLTLSATDGSTTRVLPAPASYVSDNSTFEMQIHKDYGSRVGAISTYKFDIRWAGENQNYNLAEEGFVMQADMYTLSYATSPNNFHLLSFDLTVSCDATNSRVPCTVYYYP